MGTNVYYDIWEEIVMQSDNLYQTVVLTVLLDDIGKFMHHGKFLYLNKGQHKKISVFLTQRTRGARKTTVKTNPALSFVTKTQVMTCKQFP